MGTKTKWVMKYQKYGDRFKKIKKICCRLLAKLVHLLLKSQKFKSYFREHFMKVDKMIQKLSITDRG